MRYNKKHFLRFLTKEKSNELQREYDEHKKNKLHETEKIKERIVLTNSSILNHYNQKDLNYEIEIVIISSKKTYLILF